MTAATTNAPPEGSAPPVILAAQPLIESEPTDRNHLSSALELADAGREIFPVDGKTARLPGGFKIATTDRAQIRDWWTRGPSANIGIRPDEAVVVLDVDPRDGGATNLVQLLDGRKLAPTLTVNTGGTIPGLHIYYRMGTGPWRQKLVPGVDLKAHDTGYVVAPPSVHPDTGRRYEWANHLPIATAPDWLIAACRRPHQPATRLVERRSAGVGGDRLAGLVRVVLEAAPGERNTKLNWAAYKGRDLDHRQVAEALLHAAQEIGLPLAEAERTIRSGLAGGAR